MKTTGKREQDRLKTRSAILDATAALMREEGYAAVSSRRVAERAGLKSQLVHYHFGTMEDLFLEVFRRSSAIYFSRHLQALASQDPLAEIWKLHNDREDIVLTMELVAASNHHPSLRKDMKESTDEARMMRDAVISKTFNYAPQNTLKFSPGVVSFIIAAVSRALNTEKMTGVTGGHLEVEQFMTEFLEHFRQSGATGTPAENHRRNRGD